MVIVDRGNSDDAVLAQPLHRRRRACPAKHRCARRAGLGRLQAHPRGLCPWGRAGSLAIVRTSVTHSSGLAISDLVMLIIWALSGAPSLIAMCKYEVPPTSVRISAEIVSLVHSVTL